MALRLSLLLLGLGIPAAAQSTFDVPFTYQIGGTVPAAVEYNVFSPTPVSLTLHKDSATWLSASLSAQSTPAVLTLSVDPTGLAVGTYNSTVQVQSSLGSLVWNVSLSVTAASANPLTLSSTSFTFSGVAGGSVPASQTLTVTAQSSTSATAQASEQSCSSSSWLTLSPSGSFTAGATATTFTISVNQTGITAGSACTGTITFTVGSVSQTASVTFNVTGLNSGGLTLSSTALSFTAAAGGVAPASQTLTVTAQSSTSATAQASEQSCTSSSWLTLSPSGSFTAGTAATTFTISVNQTGIAAGSACTGTITFTAGSVSQTASVTFNVTSLSSGGLTLSSTALSFTAAAGGLGPGSQSLTVTAQSRASATAQSSEQTCTSLSWLFLSPTGTFIADTTGTTFTVSVNPAGITAGSACSGTITFTSGSVTQTASVTLSVTSPPAGVLTLSATGFTFSAIAGTAAAAPAPMTLSVTASTSTGATAQVSEQGCTYRNWLTISPVGAFTASPTPTNFTVSVDQTGLVAGSTCTGTITIVAATGTQTVPVILNVISVAASALTVTPTSLTFSAPAGGTAPGAQSLTVTAQYDTSATAQATKQNCGENNWLTLSPIGAFTATSTGTTLSVSVNPTGLAAGTTCNGAILVGSAAGTRSIPITLNVTAGTLAHLTASATSLAFTAVAGGTAAKQQTITLTAPVDTSATIQASIATCTTGNWLTVSPAGTMVVGASGKTLTVSVDQSGLIAGTICSGSILVVTNSDTQTVNTTMFVTTAAGGNLSFAASPSALTFSKAADDPPPPSQVVSITGAGAPATFTVSTAGAPWLQVSPQCTLAAPCVTPNTGIFSLMVGIDPSALNAGSYVGTVVIAGTGQTTGSSSVTVSFTLTAPQPDVTLVTNAASFLTGPVSTGEMIAIFGPATNPIGPATAVSLNSVTCPAPCKNVPTSMAGVQVLFYPGGVAAPLVYVSGTQVNCIVPYEVLGATSLQVQVNYLGQKSNLQSLQYAPTQPAVFTALGTGSGLATAQQYDLQGVYQGQNSSSNPAKAGWALTFYVTGEGIIPAPAITGQVTAGPGVVPLLGPPSVLIDGLPATVTYFAEAAGFVSGMMQVNAIVPAAVHTGQAVPLSLTMNGASSQPGVVIYTK